MLKVFGQFKSSSKLIAELNILAVGSSLARGNENPSTTTTTSWLVRSGRHTALETATSRYAPQPF
jgi:hypothetical protein